jgi:iron-sulfur cluster repair protein YtfE (RIC family)
MSGSAPRLTLVREVEALPEDLIREPLAFLFAEHWRHRQYCRALSEVAQLAAVAPRLLRQMAAFLRVDMGLHVEDEEQDFFPLLRARAEPGDDLDRVLGILSADHDTDRALARAIITGLEEAAKACTGPAAISGLPEDIARFVTHQMRHIALENAVVLPIARLRLDAADRDGLAEALKARRAARAFRG